ncbi:hypothetical protein V1498_08995 [Peribacillus sp. SCS-26]|uniref:hypothetical protein n=1 Tax=Paraperibacillus marinus TaxID=3115295 RepID=UPI003905DC9B
MLESLLEIDIHLLKTAIWAGFLITLILPFTALCLSGEFHRIHKSEAFSAKDSPASFCRQTSHSCFIPIVRMIGIIRRKAGHLDADKPDSLLVAI